MKSLTDGKINHSSWAHKGEEDTGQSAAPELGETDWQIQVTIAYQSRDLQYKLPQEPVTE